VIHPMLCGRRGFHEVVGRDRVCVACGTVVGEDPQAAYERGRREERERLEHWAWCKWHRGKKCDCGGRS
jgi:hypothetical protein